MRADSITFRGVFTPTFEDEEVSNETHDVPINGIATDSEEPPQTRKPRGFAKVVQSLVDDIIKPSNLDED